jgi:hypothetical protein
VVNIGAPITIKMCFIGERFVGKTAIILRLSDGDDLEPMRLKSIDEEETKDRRSWRGRKSLQSPDLVSRQYKLPISANPIKA